MSMMNLCRELENVSVYVINLQERKDKRKDMKLQLERKKFKYEFFITTKHIYFNYLRNRKKSFI